MLDPRVEAEFMRVLSQVEYDTGEAIRSMVAVQLLWRRARQRDANGEMFYQENDWWMFLLRSARSHLFICVGRLLDKGKDAASVRDLLKRSTRNCEIFSKDQVRRRNTGFGQFSEAANQRLDEAVDPTSQDFSLLEQEFWLEYENAADDVRSIRTQLHAHALVFDDEEARKLFGPEFEEKIQCLLKGVYGLVTEVRWIVNNGGRPVEAKCGGFDSFVSSCQTEFGVQLGCDGRAGLV